MSYRWNQVTFQKSTDKKVIPTLDKLYDEFRSFGPALNAIVEKFQSRDSTGNDQNGYELTSMSNLRECVKSAATVVSSASSTLTVGTSYKTPVKHGSEFGDVFFKDENEPMLRWMSSNTVYEFDEMTPFADPSEASTGDVPTEYQSDSDSDIENEMIRTLFNNAKRLKNDGDLTGAERKFRNCLTRLSTNTSSVSLASLRSASASGVSKAELLQLLTDIYCLLESWSKAKTTMVEKLSVTERQVGKKNELYLWDTMKLAEVMMKNEEYVEAHLQGRRSLRGFKRLGEPGYKGYEECLTLLVLLSNKEGKIDEEEAYADLLGSHQVKTKRLSISRPRLETVSVPVSVPTAPEPPSPAVLQSESSPMESPSIPAPHTVKNHPIPEPHPDVELASRHSYAGPRVDVLVHKSSHDLEGTHSKDWGPLIETKAHTSPLLTKQQTPDPISSRPPAPLPIWSYMMSVSNRKFVDSLNYGQFFAEPVNNTTEMTKKMTPIELLTAYCERFHGCLPHISITHQFHGWQCMVKVKRQG
jgi:hypothetical protein